MEDTMAVCVIVCLAQHWFEGSLYNPHERHLLEKNLDDQVDIPLGMVSVVDLTKRPRMNAFALIV
jgi:hypothetical protein